MKSDRVCHHPGLMQDESDPVDVGNPQTSPASLGADPKATEQTSQDGFLTMTLTNAKTARWRCLSLPFVESPYGGPFPSHVTVAQKPDAFPEGLPYELPVWSLRSLLLPLQLEGNQRQTAGYTLCLPCSHWHKIPGANFHLCQRTLCHITYPFEISPFPLRLITDFVISLRKVGHRESGRDFRDVTELCQLRAPDAHSGLPTSPWMASSTVPIPRWIKAPSSSHFFFLFQP